MAQPLIYHSLQRATIHNTMCAFWEIPSSCRYHDEVEPIVVEQVGALFVAQSADSGVVSTYFSKFVIYEESLVQEFLAKKLIFTKKFESSQGFPTSTNVNFKNFIHELRFVDNFGHRQTVGALDLNPFIRIMIMSNFAYVAQDVLITLVVNLSNVPSLVINQSGDNLIGTVITINHHGLKCDWDIISAPVMLSDVNIFSTPNSFS